MNILHLIDSPNKGGAETLVFDLCNNSKVNGINIFLLMTKKTTLFYEFKAANIRLIYINRRLPIDLNLVLKIKKIVRANDIKVIHAHQAVDAFHAYLASLITGVKVVISFHGYTKSFKNNLILRFLIHRVDANICVSRSFLKRLEEEIKFSSKKNFNIIYNGVDSKKFYKTDKSFKKELKLAEGDQLLGMIGNFNENIRDQITVCKALPNIFLKYPNMHFVFVGRKDSDSQLYYNACLNFCKENRILDKVHFTGSRLDINNVLNSLDIFVYSSNYDTFGIAVVEAQMSGIPTVINDLPTLMEITSDGKYAQVFKTKDYKDLEIKVSELLDNEKYRKTLAEEGRNWALKNYSIERHILNLKNLYQEIL